MPDSDSPRLSAGRASRLPQALTSSVARAAGCELSSLATGGQHLRGAARPHCLGQGRSSRLPVKACEPLDPERLRLASSQPSGWKWSPVRATRAVLPSNRNTLSRALATRLSRLWVAAARYLTSYPTPPVKALLALREEGTCCQSLQPTCCQRAPARSSNSRASGSRPTDHRFGPCHPPRAPACAHWQQHLVRWRRVAASGIPDPEQRSGLAPTALAVTMIARSPAKGLPPSPVRAGHDLRQSLSDRSQAA